MKSKRRSGRSSRRYGEERPLRHTIPARGSHQSQNGGQGGPIEVSGVNEGGSLAGNESSEDLSTISGFLSGMVFLHSSSGTSFSSFVRSGICWSVGCMAWFLSGVGPGFQGFQETGNEYLRLSHSRDN